MPKKEVQAFQLNALINAPVIDLKQRRIVNAAPSVNIYDYVTKFELQNLGIQFGDVNSGAGIQAIAVDTSPAGITARVIINNNGLEIIDASNNVRSNFTLTDLTNISDIAGNNFVLLSSTAFVVIGATDGTAVIQFAKTTTNLTSGKFQVNSTDVISAAGVVVAAISTAGVINTSNKYQLSGADVINAASAFVGSGGVNVGSATITTSGSVIGGTINGNAMVFNAQSVSKGAANSGGTGFAVLRVPN